MAGNTRRPTTNIGNDSERRRPTIVLLCLKSVHIRRSLVTVQHSHCPIATPETRTNLGELLDSGFGFLCPPSVLSLWSFWAQPKTHALGSLLNPRTPLTYILQISFNQCSL